ncbi:MspA family porin [Rhodococcus erythropolis]|nr:MspA family porin [Rhodococcus erythropolis]MDV6212678.1 MspA family porin [Rhodococcus erythropolis]
MAIVQVAESSTHPQGVRHGHQRPESTRTLAEKRRAGKTLGVFAAVSSVLMVGSLAFAGSASDTPTALPDKFARTVTDDGWTLKLAATKLSANPVPNLATTTFTREGFVSAKVAGTISGAGNLR